MSESIYVQLLEEGTKVYRPVPAREIEKGVYEIQGFEMHAPEDEVWEFRPGTFVLVEEQNFDGKIVLVAVKQQNHK